MKKNKIKTLFLILLIVIIMVLTVLIIAKIKNLNNMNSKTNICYDMVAIDTNNVNCNEVVNVISNEGFENVALSEDGKAQVDDWNSTDYYGTVDGVSSSDLSSGCYYSSWCLDVDVSQSNKLYQEIPIEKTGIMTLSFNYMMLDENANLIVGIIEKDENLNVISENTDEIEFSTYGEWLEYSKAIDINENTKSIELYFTTDNFYEYNNIILVDNVSFGSEPIYDIVSSSDYLDNKIHIQSQVDLLSGKLPDQISYSMIIDNALSLDDIYINEIEVDKELIDVKDYDKEKKELTVENIPRLTSFKIDLYFIIQDYNNINFPLVTNQKLYYDDYYVADKNKLNINQNLSELTLEQTISDETGDSKVNDGELLNYDLKITNPNNTPSVNNKIEIDYNNSGNFGLFGVMGIKVYDMNGDELPVNEYSYDLNEKEVYIPFIPADSEYTVKYGLYVNSIKEIDTVSNSVKVTSNYENPNNNTVIIVTSIEYNKESGYQIQVESYIEYINENAYLQVHFKGNEINTNSNILINYYDDNSDIEYDFDNMKIVSDTRYLKKDVDYSLDQGMLKINTIMPSEKIYITIPIDIRKIDKAEIWILYKTDELKPYDENKKFIWVDTELIA